MGQRIGIYSPYFKILFFFSNVDIDWNHGTCYFIGFDSVFNGHHVAVLKMTVLKNGESIPDCFVDTLKILFHD
jgi:hypothetical protein